MLKKKKILILSLNFYPRFVGGAEIAIDEIVKRQNIEKYEWYMITLRFDSNLPKYELIKNIHVYRIGFSKINPSISDLNKFPLKLNKYLYQLIAVFYCFKLNKKYKFDILWAMMAHASGIPAGIFKFFNPKIKYILSLQEGDPLDYIEKKFFLSWPLFKNGFRKANIIQSISSFLNDWAVKITKNNNNKIIIPNGVNLSIFDKLDYLKIEKIKKELNKKDDEIFLITTSRLVIKNAIDICIKSLEFVSENIKFLILGIGPEKDNLLNLVKKLNLEKKVVFLDHINYDDIPYYLINSDIFIRPSRSEGMGNSFIEAMAAKIPVIATNEGGLRDFIFDRKTAYLVRKDNIEDIVKAINDIINKTEQKNEIINNAFEFIKDKYNWNIIASKFDKEIFN